MQYYQFHLGDYISHTAHLEPLEDLAYRRLLDLYYSTESPIPNNIPWVSRRLRLGSDVIEIVLNEFFQLSEDVWHNHRCDTEISKFNEWIDKQRSNGKKGGRPRKQPQNKPIANPSKSDGKPIVKPPTTHNPLPKTKEGGSTALQELVNWSESLGAPLTVQQITKWRGVIGRVAAETEFTIEKQAAAFRWAREKNMSFPKSHFWRDDIVDWASRRKKEMQIPGQWAAH